MKTNLHNMKHKLNLFITGLAVLVAPSHLHAQGSAFTYQGRLNSGGGGVGNGLYDFVFSVYDSATSPRPVVSGSAVTAVPVSNGLFVATVDFGGGVFTGADRWLEIAVRTNAAASYTLLSPRQQLTSTPYAITAATVSGAVAAAQLTGVVGGAQLGGGYPGAVTFSSPANSFAGNGGGLTNVNAATLGGLPGQGFWQTGGNSGTTPGADYLGTSDNQPVELHVNGQRALRLEPNASGPNVIGGSSGNFVSAGSGVTISGGAQNQGGNNFATVSGGATNIATGLAATVGGGANNYAGRFSFVGGGQGNSAANLGVVAGGATTDCSAAYGSTIGGGAYNAMDMALSYCTIAGGEGNFIQSGPGLILHLGSVISGGVSNFVHGNCATVAGGSNCVAYGDFALAAGKNARAVHDGAFVWADSQDGLFQSATNDQFAVRAANGVTITSGATTAALELRSGGIKVTGAGVGTSGPAFIHRAQAGNTSGHITIIDNPFSNGDPNAILIVTANWNPGGGGGVYNNHAIGVYYSASRWSIFNQDLVAMPNNAAFNVLVIKP